MQRDVDQVLIPRAQIAQRGQHFGKKWKHGVRTAQVYLRRRGEIRLENGLWRLNV